MKIQIKCIIDLYEQNNYLLSSARLLINQTRCCNNFHAHNTYFRSDHHQFHYFTIICSCLQIFFKSLYHVFLKLWLLFFMLFVLCKFVYICSIIHIKYDNIRYIFFVQITKHDISTSISKIKSNPHFHIQIPQIFRLGSASSVYFLPSCRNLKQKIEYFNDTFWFSLFCGFLLYIAFAFFVCTFERFLLMVDNSLYIVVLHIVETPVLIPDNEL